MGGCGSGDKPESQWRYYPPRILLVNKIADLPSKTSRYWTRGESRSQTVVSNCHEVAPTPSPPLSSPAPEFLLEATCVVAASIASVIFVVSLLSNMVDAQSIRLSVDLTDAPQNIYHSRLTIPVKPGPMTLVYPKWIPGNHRPSGPIANVTGIKMESGGHTLAWQRDPVDMYSFHVEVPAGANELQVSLDTITDNGSAGANGPAATTNVLDLNWNQVVLYPQDASSDEVQVQAAVKLTARMEIRNRIARQHEERQRDRYFHSGLADHTGGFSPHRGPVIIAGSS